MNKKTRHQKIIELIETSDIGRQETLLELLRAEGYNVTQATVSRDIKELHLAKAANEKGEYRYVVREQADDKKRFEMIFSETVLDADAAGNIVLVKCRTGMANAACELFDAETERKAGEWAGVVGTLSGDNTFLIITRTEAFAHELCAHLAKYRRSAAL